VIFDGESRWRVSRRPWLQARDAACLANRGTEERRRSARRRAGGGEESGGSDSSKTVEGWGWEEAEQRWTRHTKQEEEVIRDKRNRKRNVKKQQTRESGSGRKEK